MEFRCALPSTREGDLFQKADQPAYSKNANSEEAHPKYFGLESKHPWSLPPRPKEMPVDILTISHFKQNKIITHICMDPF